MGHFLCHLSYRDRQAQQQVFVVDNLKTNLLGLPAIMALQMASRTETQSSTNWLKRFQNVFQGLGTLSGEYKIRLHPDAKPHAIFTPRHIPLPLRSQVEDELKRMEETGVISKVSEHTEWCGRSKKE